MNPNKIATNLRVIHCKCIKSRIEMAIYQSQQVQGCCFIYLFYSEWTSGHTNCMPSWSDYTAMKYCFFRPMSSYPSEGITGSEWQAELNPYRPCVIMTGQQFIFDEAAQCRFVSGLCINRIPSAIEIKCPQMTSSHPCNFTVMLWPVGLTLRGHIH